jgi:hypothetical protein
MLRITPGIEVSGKAEEIVAGDDGLKDSDT